MHFDLTTLDPLALTGAPREASVPEGSTLDILVVDDHPANRLLLCQQLGFLGHRCEVAEHGAEGLTHWLDRHFDLVIADCNMPVMNGYDLAREIRRHEQQSERPRCTVLGFTANAQPEEKQRCREAGMDDCLFKPISLSALNDRLSRVAVLHPHPRALADASSAALFDMDSIGALTGNSPEMIERLLAQLTTSNRDDRQELLEAQGRIALRDVAHKIKGAARIIQANEVIDACERLEQLCDAPAHPELGDAKERLLVAMRALEDGLSSRRGGEHMRAHGRG
jgi:two-component system sensor histidine kinase EvgS